MSTSLARVAQSTFVVCTMDLDDPLATVLWLDYEGLWNAAEEQAYVFSTLAVAEWSLRDVQAETVFADPSFTDIIIELPT